MSVDDIKLVLKKLDASLDFCEELVKSRPKNELDQKNAALQLKHAKKQVIGTCMGLDKLLK